jgi:anhydro-N-acetylmuramic acid kinase
MDPVGRLLALRDKPVRRIVGLMSGTSADGIDAGLIELDDETRSVRLLAFVSTPMPAALRARLHDARRASAEKLCGLDALLGERFAEAALAVIAAAGLQPADVDLVGSHGQTISHLPPSASPEPSTLQIGEGAVIAERTGLPVICDFRARDLAAGGEGAPLVPVADEWLFRAPGKVRAIQNIGGIGNVTIVASPAHRADLLAFDTGPGNMPLDAVARAASRGPLGYDVDGARAARGTIDQGLLDELHKHPFFDRPPPRSTGREEFGDAWLAPLLSRFLGREDDLLATLTRLTAESISRSYARWVPIGIDEVYVSGGGVHNATLMRHLAELCAPAPVASTEVVGVDPDAREAIAFAILANETLMGRPGNVVRATGARGPRVLGKIVPA